MTTAKTPAKAASGWTDAQVAQLTSGYTGDNTKLGSLVAGKSAVACRSKLVNLGLYKKNEEAKTEGTATAAKMGKVQIVSAIETLLSLPVDSLASLEKASKPELQKLVDKLINLSDQKAADQVNPVEVNPVEVNGM